MQTVTPRTGLAPIVEHWGVRDMSVLPNPIHLAPFCADFDDVTSTPCTYIRLIVDFNQDGDFDCFLAQYAGQYWQD